MGKVYQPTGDRQTTSPQNTPISRELELFWEKITPQLFRTGLTRTSRDNGKTYPRNTQGPIPGTIPEAPSALKIYTDEGQAHCIALDFDSSTWGPARVQREVDHIIKDLGKLGFDRFIVDASPNGGQHLYLPLTDPIPFQVAKLITNALADRYSTLDPSPMNGLTDGVIRGPGSVHKSGGHQEPVTSYGAALMAVHIRNPRSAVEALYEWAAGGKQAAKHTNPNLKDGATSLPVSGKELISHARSLTPTRSKALPLMPEWAQFAKDGKWDKARFKSASEARLAFARACVRAGYDFATFLAAMKSSEFVGAASLYARYASHHRVSSMARDFSKGHSYKAGDSYVQDWDTRGTYTPPIKGDFEKSGFEKNLEDEEKEAEYQWIRGWFSKVKAVEAGRWDPSERIVLRALGAFAQRKGSRQVAVGVRSLALGTGLSASTVSRVLVGLRGEKDPFIRLLAPARGLEAAVYELVVPEHLGGEPAAWLRGLIPAVDKAFFGLPVAAPLVYEVLSASPVSSIDLATVVGLPVRTVQAVLEELKGLGLVATVPGGWVLGAADLGAAAKVSGGALLFETMVKMIRAQRQVWFTWWMGVVTRAGESYTPKPGDRGVRSASGEVWDPGSGVWVPAEVLEAGGLVSARAPHLA